MPKSAPKDNQTFAHKKALRQQALKLLAERGIHTPVVLESHAGTGKLWEVCYEHLPFGVALEKNPDKTTRLAKQRPAWAIYECDCEVALGEGIGSLWTIDLLDCDPYGACWSAIEAFFVSERPFADVMVVVVNCGLRLHLTFLDAWKSPELQPMVERFGNDLRPIYLEVCGEMLRERVARAGYEVQKFAGYYCGKNQNMTHFLALLTRPTGASVA
jgi:hypothetical protein